MKKQYSQPTITIIEIDNEGIIAQSAPQYSRTSVNGVNVGYGGQADAEADEVVDTYRTMIWAK